MSVNLDGTPGTCQSWRCQTQPSESKVGRICFRRWQSVHLPHCPYLQPPKPCMRKYLRCNAGHAAACLGLVAFALAVPGVPAISAQEGRKRALIIAIGEYGTPPVNPRTGQPLRPYRDLSSGNDVALVRGALEHQGFLAANIRVVRDAEADLAGMRRSLRRLVRDTDEGDVVVLHYSGHGHRIGNDNPEGDDEPDGLDEVLVPFGAPDEAYEGYDGSLHFRDDELGAVIAEIRGRAGPRGSVTVFLDACYSGTGTRGDDDLPTRGSEDPLGPAVFARGAAPATRGGPADTQGTGIDMGRPTATRGGDTELAPFAVFSAASPRQMAKETFDVDGRTRVGSLSYAIARALPKAGPGTTNRAFFAAITRSLSGKVSSQTPQMEGDADRQLFSNRLTQQLPYVVVDSVAAEGVILGGGSLLGLNAGTRLAVHPLGTSSPDASSALANIRVLDSSPTRARAEVVSGDRAAIAGGAWAFVTEPSYGDLALRVRLDASLPERDMTGLERALGAAGLVEFVSEGADVIVASRNGQPEARTTADNLLLGSGAQRVRAAVEDFARNRYLRRLSFDTPELDIVLEIAPGAQILQRANGASYCSDADWEGADARPENLGGGQWRLAPGDVYWVRARNVGERRAFVHFVDLRPRGEIDVKRPPAGQPPQELEAGREMDLGCYRVAAGDVGHEVLKLFATGTAQDLRPWFQTSGTRGSEELALSREISIHIQSNQESRE